MKATEKPAPRPRPYRVSVTFRMHPEHAAELDRVTALVGLDRGAVIQLCLNAHLPVLLEEVRAAKPLRPATTVR